MRVMRTIAALVVAGMALFAGSVQAQEQAGRARLLGAWSLQAYDLEFQDSGEHRPALGAHPRGTVVFTPEGRMVVYLEDADRRRYLILSNTSTALTLEAGVTPTSGAYKIVRAGSALQEVKYDGFVRTAVGGSLETLGRNLGVARPVSDTSDDIFRQLIPLFSWEPKQTRTCIERVLGVLLGGRRSPTTPHGWDCLEINNNEIIVELYGPPLADGRASYLLRTASTVGAASNPKTSYAALNASTDGPRGRMPLVAAGPVWSGASGTINAATLKRLLAAYVKAAGVRVTVVFLED